MRARRCVSASPVPASTGADGFSYEEKAITKWLKKNATSPMTGDGDRSNRLVANINLKKIIKCYLE